MKPGKILLFLCLVFTLILLASWFFPEQGAYISPKIKVNFHWSLSDLKPTAIQYANIESIIEENLAIIVADTIIAIDSLENPKIDTLRAKASTLRKKIQTIEYPDQDSTLLYAFFNKLNNSSNKRMRILHYGDSQIEGDRITGYLRNKFQKQFGGSGPGLLPAIPGHAESASIQHHASQNWIKHAVYYKSDTILPHRKFGLLGSFARFTSYKHDSLPDNEIYTATINFKKSGMAYRSVNNFTRCRVFYGHTNKALNIKGFVNDSLIWFEEIEPIQKTQSFQWEFENAPTNFTIEFEGTNSPDIYGIALDAPNGVAVDNLPFRGSSGTEFTRLDFTQLKEMTKELNPGLLILEFGVNIVPHQVKNYNYYERIMTHQINYLKKVMPGTPILVIGLSDMSQRKGNYFETFPNLEKVKQAQYNAAKNTHCAFWDMYKAMGGKNSMPSWVFAEPPLASSDFIHFNRKGGHIIAQMLYNALMIDYKKYQNQSNQGVITQK
jgi:hypothetical protein